MYPATAARSCSRIQRVPIYKVVQMIDGQVLVPLLREVAVGLLAIGDDDRPWVEPLLNKLYRWSETPPGRVTLQIPPKIHCPSIALPRCTCGGQTYSCLSQRSFLGPRSNPANLERGEPARISSLLFPFDLGIPLARTQHGLKDRR